MIDAIVWLMLFLSKGFGVFIDETEDEQDGLELARC